ncbi:RND superfamily efflux pump MFP component [Desulfoluna limicola]|uniref:RND superfamily efflux pump MFP component n=1 Tax=Desulfoluna limicola TaxID=2810562 RepID=A0ABM7PB71_9BACT|nr:efflux RND transporter periplasmic adaptor subunit [Desulfoluna limicola]BCS94409.1 RND superfamily efflux pump MFP component [Desulfoluna limicola]
MIPNPMPPVTKPASRTLVRVGLPLLIIAAAIALAALIFITKPKAQKRPRTSLPPLVSWEETRLGDHRVTVSTMGTVLASTQIELKARVGGQVEWLSPNLIPGGRFKKGDILLTLDKADLNLALATARGKLKQAQADLALEQGNQDVARRELALMEVTTGRAVKDQALALRKPQLEKAEAGLALAAADLDKALLDHTRSDIRAPFDGMVLSRSTPTGTLVTAGQTVATLTGDDTWWVEATLPVKDLPWLILPQGPGTSGSKARIRTQNGTVFEGSLLRLLGDLNDKSRMARLLIEVRDPMGQSAAMGAPPLLLNSYVRAELEGKSIAGIIALPDRALRGEGEVWVAEGDKLRIRKVDIFWREGATLFVGKGLKPGERVILSDLSSPVDGMAIRTGDEKPEKKEKKGQPPARRG